MIQYRATSKPLVEPVVPNRLLALGRGHPFNRAGPVSGSVRTERLCSNRKGLLAPMAGGSDDSFVI